MQSTNSMTLNFILIDPCCRLNNKTMTPQFIAAESYCDQDISCNYILRVIGNGLSMMTEWGNASLCQIMIHVSSTVPDHDTLALLPVSLNALVFSKSDCDTFLFELLVSLKSNFDKKLCDSIEICFVSRCMSAKSALWYWQMLCDCQPQRRPTYIYQTYLVMVPASHIGFLLLVRCSDVETHDWLDL